MDIGQPPSDWRDRVKAEYAQLEDRFIKLGRFMTTDDFMQLPEEDMTLLVAQSDHMHEYLSVLRNRIARFSKGGA